MVPRRGAMMDLPNLLHDESSLGGCHCDGGQPKNFLRPCLLLLLAESPSHGYDLMERLRPFGFDVTDPATVYRSLRQLEEESLLSSCWDTSNRGPARRIYAVTPDGLDLLGGWTHVLAQNRRILDLFLDRYATRAESPESSHGGPVRRLARKPNEPRRSLQRGRT